MSFQLVVFHLVFHSDIYVLQVQNVLFHFVNPYKANQSEMECEWKMGGELRIGGK